MRGSKDGRGGAEPRLVASHMSHNRRKRPVRKKKKKKKAAAARLASQMPLQQNEALSPSVTSEVEAKPEQMSL